MKYTIAMMGYAPEEETTVLELTYNYGVTENTKGTAYAQVQKMKLLFYFYTYLFGCWYQMLIMLMKI